MKFYNKEVFLNENVRMTAGEKARDDLDAIMEDIGFQELLVYYKDADKKDTKNPFKKVAKQIGVFRSFKTAYAGLNQGDTLFIQFPTKQSTVFYPALISRLRKKGVRLILLVHDLETLRLGRLKSTPFLKKIKMKLMEISTLRSASKVIVHNKSMVELLASMGVDEGKMVPLGIFDYLIPNYDASRREGKTGKNKHVIVAGNLRPQKVGYAYNLPTNCDFNLYGVDFSGRLHGSSKYFGAFPPNEIPYVMEGSFGLVWDGRLAETCSDVFGEYLRINCPHKASLYLASGIPVAIWKQAALADFIEKNHVGITVESLYNLHPAIDKVTDAEYAEMVKNAEKIGEKLRAGEYTKEAIRHCE